MLDQETVRRARARWEPTNSLTNENYQMNFMAPEWMIKVLHYCSVANALRVVQI